MQRRPRAARLRLSIAPLLIAVLAGACAPAVPSSEGSDATYGQLTTTEVKSLGRSPEPTAPPTTELITVPTTDPRTATTGVVKVYAAISMKAALTEVGKAFAAANLGVTAEFTFDKSSSLIGKIEKGGEADLFIAADQTFMNKFIDAGLAGSFSAVVALDPLQIVVAPGNPTAVGGLSDLARPEVRVVLCDSSRPCGKFPRRLLKTAKITVTPISLEKEVAAVVAKVGSGGADAGVIYASEVVAAGPAVSGVAIPGEVNIPAEHAMAVVKKSTHDSLNVTFADFILSPAGQEILARYGYLSPAPPS